MNRFEERVVEEVKSRRLLDAGARVICAVSGGPDSVALARSLAATADETGIGEIVVAHFDHRMRPESGADAEWVRELAASLDLGYYRGSADVPALQACFRQSPEEAARFARRDFLLRIKARTGADAVALGHHMTDRAETFFINLVRGAGARGLGAMRVRKMTETAEAFAREDDALAELADTTTGKYLSENGITAVLNDEFRGNVIPAVAARLIQLAYGRVGKRRRTLERAHIEAVLTLADGSTVNLPGGYSAGRFGAVTVFRPAMGPAIKSWRVVVPVLGKATVPGVGYAIKAGGKNAAAPADYAVTLDEEAVGGHLVVRSRKPGDRIRPAGLGGTRKLQDVFVDAKVPQDVRVLYPVIGSEKEVFTVPGLAVSEDAAPRANRPTVTITITCSGVDPFDRRDG
jgi:tRNA(Ile)-lysidine synthetase-like protein